MPGQECVGRTEHVPRQMGSGRGQLLLPDSRVLPGQGMGPRCRAQVG
jgi:hypothetical protein